MRKTKKVLMIGLFGTCLLGTALAAGDLEREFTDPPDAAKPWVMWFWNMDFVCKEAITWEMEAYKRSGVNGLQLFANYENLHQGFKFSIQGQSKNRAQPLSDEWYECIRHTMKEAERLGMQLCFHNEPGYSGAGGPWISVEHSLRKLVESQVDFIGPGAFDKELPFAGGADYRDVAVLAYRLPDPGADISASSFHPRYPLSWATDGNNETFWVSNGELPGQAPTAAKPEWISFTYAEPFVAGAVLIEPRPGFGPRECELQISDDGQAWKPLKSFTVANIGPQQFDIEAPPGRFFRLLITSSHVQENTQISELALLKPGQSGISTLLPEQVVELTSQVGGDGKLNWMAPEGRWRIIRYGHVSTGAKIHPASPVAEGFECDKMNPEAVRHHFEKGMIGRILALEPGLNGKTVVGVELDSYEGGDSDWTPAFREEFRKRRGYDLLPWLPAWRGESMVVGRVESEKFRHDVKRTVAELCADVYYDGAVAFCHARKVKLYTESYGTPLWDPLTTAGRVDVPQAEFWVNGSLIDTVRLMASAAHTTGKKVVTAEAFTYAPKRDPWWITPYDLKALGDQAYCMGSNHTILTEASLQFWQDRVKPGMTFDVWGTPFSVNQTWWKPGRAWLGYQARCHAMLQQGRFVADILVLSPFPAKEANCWASPIGFHRNYNFDLCAEEVFLKQARCENGQIVLGEMRYQLLQLINSELLRPEIMAKLVELVGQGAVVVGSRPTGAPGLEGGTETDRQVKEAAEKLWGTMPGEPGKEHRFGKGRVVQGAATGEVLAEMGIPPDVEVSENILWTHRQTAEADIYFLSNQQPQTLIQNATFRVSGKRPELWDATTGEIRPLPEYQESNGRITVPLQFEPHQSWFVVFGKETGSAFANAAADKNLKLETRNSEKKNFPELKPIMELTGAWSVQFDPKWGGPADAVRFDKLVDWTVRPEPGIKFYSGTAAYQTSFDVEPQALDANTRGYLDIGSVNKLAEISINGRPLGIVWCPPWRVLIPAGLLKAKANTLEIKVTNTWVNRLIGDEREPDDAEWSAAYADVPFENKHTRSLLKEPDWLANKTPRPSKGRFAFATYKHLQASDKLQESGLLGPVRLMTTE